MLVSGFRWFNRVPFENSLAFLSQGSDSGLKQLRRNSLLSVTVLYVKAGHTSDFIRILALQSAGAIQPREICSLAESAPPDRLTLIVRDQASHGSIFDHRAQPFFCRWPLEVLPFLSWLDPPPHTPTAAAGAFLSKKLFQVFPQAGSHFFYLNFHPA
jgi:hypothetical protein